MRQVVCTAFDADPAVSVRVETAAPPVCPRAGVVVAIAARPINPADVLLLGGRHLYRPPLPAPLGVEGAGVVVEVGPESRFAVGDRVAIPWGGTWRERMAVEDDGVLPLPPGTDLEQASMLSVNPFTAAGLLEGLPAGACLALNAGTSAVSALILALCRARGLRAVAVVRDESTRALVLSRGAAAVVVEGPDLPARLREAAGAPLVRALDAVAGQASGQLHEALSEGGELWVYGLLASDEVRLPAAGVVFRDVTIRGYSRLRALRALKPERRAAVTRELVGLVAGGVLSTPVEARYPLESAVEALRHDAQPGRRGKIVLVSPGVG
jgi:trans-2-enoyl-CoA reductase